MEATLNPQQQILKNAREYANLNLRQGCRELIEMSETCILPSGVVRETAGILNELGSSSTLGLAISLFEDEAIKFAAENAS